MSNRTPYVDTFAIWDAEMESNAASERVFDLTYRRGDIDLWSPSQWAEYDAAYEEQRAASGRLARARALYQKRARAMAYAGHDREEWG